MSFKTITFLIICILLIFIFSFIILFSAEKTEFFGIISDSSNFTNEIKTIIIDPGHGGEDGGAVSDSGILEKDLNLDISLKLKNYLQKFGYNVIMTRTEDILLYDRNTNYKGHKKSQDLAERLRISKTNPDALFISIHMNAFPQKKYSGLQVYYKDGNANGKVLADIIQYNVKRYALSDNIRQSKAVTDSIFLLNNNPNTSILIECGFLSNDEECKLLSTDEYRDKLALIFCMSIIQYLSQN